MSKQQVFLQVKPISFMDLTLQIHNKTKSLQGATLSAFQTDIMNVKIARPNGLRERSILTI